MMDQSRGIKWWPFPERRDSLISIFISQMYLHPDWNLPHHPCKRHFLSDDHLHHGLTVLPAFSANSYLFFSTKSTFHVQSLISLEVYFLYTCYKGRFMRMRNSAELNWLSHYSACKEDIIQLFVLVTVLYTNRIYRMDIYEYIWIYKYVHMEGYLYLALLLFPFTHVSPNKKYWYFILFYYLLFEHLCDDILL